jgi:3-phenylpropionate/trans-cinnamate dioxygenase ferredoxin subunit
MRKERVVPGPHWVPTIDDSKVRDGAYVPVYPKGVGVLLVRAGGELFAIANKCAHMACPLDGGRLEGDVITCPCHDWQFNVRSGAFLDAPELSIATYPVKVEDGKVHVGLGER